MKIKVVGIMIRGGKKILIWQDGSQSEAPILGYAVAEVEKLKRQVQALQNCLAERRESCEHLYNAFSALQGHNAARGWDFGEESFSHVVKYAQVRLKRLSDD